MAADDAIPTHYSNWVRPIPGRFDLALDFGYVAGVATAGSEPDWVARIVLSWEEVRVLEDVLRTQIAAYQEHVGAIRDVEHTKPPSAWELELEDEREADDDEDPGPD